MKRIKFDKIQCNSFGKFGIWNLIFFMTFTVAAANDRVDATIAKNNITITENDFKRMVLDSKTDSVLFNLELKKHLASNPLWNNGYEFMIITIPISDGFEGIRAGNGQRIFNKTRGEKSMKKMLRR